MTNKRKAKRNFWIGNIIFGLWIGQIFAASEQPVLMAIGVIGGLVTIAITTVNGMIAWPNRNP